MLCCCSLTASKPSAQSAAMKKTLNIKGNIQRITDICLSIQKVSRIEVTLSVPIASNDLLYAVAFLYIWNMKAIVVTPKSENEFKFVADLLKKLGIGTSTLTKGEIEDFGMLKLMKNIDKSKRASRTEIMKKLTA